MEIRIKTADEIRDGRIRIEITAEDPGEDPGEAMLVAERLAGSYPSELDWAAVRAERDEARERAARRERKIEELEEGRRADHKNIVAQRSRIAELEVELDRYRKAHVCTSRCSMNSHVAFEGNRIVKDLEEVLAQVRSELRETHRARMAAEDRARRAEADLAAATQEASLARRQILDLGEEIIRQRERADRVSGAVHGQELVQAALRTDWTSWSEREAAALASAIRAVRDALGSPLIGPPSPPKAVTSQA